MESYETSKNKLIIKDITNHIEEDITRLLKEGNIKLNFSVEKIFTEYKKDLVGELEDSGFDKNNVQHINFIKNIIKAEVLYKTVKKLNNNFIPNNIYCINDKIIIKINKSYFKDNNKLGKRKSLLAKPFLNSLNSLDFK